MLKRFYAGKKYLEAGLDEAGRGCLAGPVFSSAVIFDQLNEDSYLLNKLNDSKKLNVDERYKLREIIEQECLAFAVCHADHTEIDKINILNASFLAMHRCIDALKVKPGLLLVDGNRFTPYFDIPHVCIIKGDGKYLSIAAASVLAKTYRDDYMIAMHEKYPQYQWHINKGYPTKKHREMIQQHGLSEIHRMSFKSGIVRT